MPWMERLIWSTAALVPGGEFLGTNVCYRDLSLCSAVSGLTCTIAHAVVSRDHETPSGVRHPARTMKYTKVSGFLKPAAGRYPRNAMGIWLCWDAASDLGSHAYMMLNMPSSASGQMMPSKAFNPGAGHCTVQNWERGARVAQAASEGLELATPASATPPPPVSKAFLQCLACGLLYAPWQCPPQSCGVSSGL